MRVTEDDYRFSEWPDRKPSKSSKLAAKIREHPVDYALERATKVGASKARSVSRAASSKVLRSGGVALLGSVGAVAASAAILATAYVVANEIAKNGRAKLGDRVNAISQRYVQAQQDIERKLGVSTWAAVPAEVRSKWLSDYKRALGTANSQAQGTAFAGVRESYK